MKKKKILKIKLLRLFCCLVFLLQIISCLSQYESRLTYKAQIDRHQPYNFQGQHGMVVAAHPLAANAGLDMLKKGGNAIDAAIATAFTLNTVEPFASGVGGGGFMVIYLADEQKITVINYREKAPAKAHPKMFMEDGKLNNKLRREHGLAVAVPGALAGWDYALKKYGTKKISDVIQRAVEHAENGYTISRTFSKINKDEYEKILLLAGETTCYLNNGFPYEPGDTILNPDLARFFKKIAAKGIDEFYKGGTARKIVKAVRDKGGIMTLEDLAKYKVIETEPLKGTYKDYDFYSIRPPGSGGLHMIQLLNMLEQWPVKKWGHNSSSFIHHFSEALRFVFADRSRYLGDPDHVFVPVNGLISKDYAFSIVQRIKPKTRLESYPSSELDEKPHEAESTTHLCVIDNKGNIVSLTQSINHFFGSGIVSEGTGFLLNNHMDDFASIVESPNAPNGNRRPVSSMGPMIVFKDKTPFLVLGSPGGTRIFSSLTQIVMNIIEFDMSMDEAIEAPRFFSYSIGGRPRPIYYESRIPKNIIQALESYGHKLQMKEAYDTFFGGAQGILILLGKRLILGGADSRRDGYGAGY